MSSSIYFHITTAADGTVKAATSLPGHHPFPHSPIEQIAHAMAYALAKRVPLDFDSSKLPALALAQELISPEGYGHAVTSEVRRDAKAIVDSIRHSTFEVPA